MEKCNVLFPGGFKPVHTGHISLIIEYLENEDYDVNATIIISRASREGIQAKSSKWFLEKIFARDKRVNVIISPDASPIKTVYDYIGEKKLGKGIYAMATSSKGDDLRRAEDCANKFSEGGKYHTEGVQVILFPAYTAPITYTERSDISTDTPISSTIVRADLRDKNGDAYAKFRTSYIPLLEEKLISEKTLKEYYAMLKSEILPLKNNLLRDNVNEEILLEGGAGGHMAHPYDIDEFSFLDLTMLIRDLFSGNIENIEEKLDGQNLFASVDEYGNTIFARNSTHLKELPWKLDDIINNPKWEGNPSVQHAFSNGAKTIDMVFKNIPKATEFFNYNDKQDKIRYRHWVNLEILDTQNFNVIPYVESKVSIHGFKTVVFDYNDIDNPEYSIIDVEPEVHGQMKEVLDKAIQKTNKTTFKAQLTPEVILKAVEDGEVKAHKYYNYIEELLANAGLDDLNTTIAEYKEHLLRTYISKNGKLKFLEGEVLDMLIRRWIHNDKSYKINDIKKIVTAEEYSAIREFDKDYLAPVIKKIMYPLDKMFIRLGNEVLKNIKGLANAGHEKEVVANLSKEIRDIEAAIKNSDDSKLKLKLETALKRLAEVNYELNATEGIVFKYKGQTLKLTGSFAPLNQVFGLKFGKFQQPKK